MKLVCCGHNSALLTQLAEASFQKFCPGIINPRVNFFGDDTEWLADAKTGLAKIIMIDSTNPMGPANGLDNADFYRNYWLALWEGGLLVQPSESPLPGNACNALDLAMLIP